MKVKNIISIALIFIGIAFSYVTYVNSNPIYFRTTMNEIYDNITIKINQSTEDPWVVELFRSAYPVCVRRRLNLDGDVQKTSFERGLAAVYAGNYECIRDKYKYWEDYFVQNVKNAEDQLFRRRIKCVIHILRQFEPTSMLVVGPDETIDELLECDVSGTINYEILQQFPFVLGTSCYKEDVMEVKVDFLKAIIIANGNPSAEAIKATMDEYIMKTIQKHTDFFYCIMAEIKNENLLRQIM